MWEKDEILGQPSKKSKFHLKYNEGTLHYAIKPFYLKTLY